MKVYSILYMTIWNKVSEIPRGRVATYGQIARLIGLSNQARLIGYALHRLPASTAVPWYRVVNRKGKISLSESEGGYQLQVALLEAEGVRVEQGVIDLNKY
ncbi:methylated-DNA--[protein]-cysteine S-methyltransferase, partial [candidate division KSB1 bacterium]|nr:methylated-DNA--[protein]-cysteine S-methyltransferase [candidate division KSB1 bacterium]